MARYYITDTMDGRVFKTDNSELANELSYCEDNFVIDTETDELIQMGTIGERFQILEHREAQ